MSQNHSKKLDAQTWKLIRRSAACLPLALAAVHTGTQAQVPASVEVGGSQAATWTSHHEFVLGTSLEVQIRAADRKQAQRAEAAALAEFDRQENILSAWRENSEFCRWEKTRFTAIKVSPELMSVLAGFDRWRTITNGALDPSAEAAIRLWRSALNEGRTPTDTEIAETRVAMQQQHWELDAAAGTATRLTDVPLALASFAKSYVSERAAAAALRAGAQGVLLNVGGDVIARGSMQQTIGITDPFAASDNAPNIAHVRVADRAVATSGSYKRALQVASTTDDAKLSNFSHIVDPRTATPAQGVVSSTVIARDAETAGALATAFSVLPIAESKQLAATLRGVDFMIVDADGKQIRSAGWAQYEAPRAKQVVYLQPAAPAEHAAAGFWNPSFELSINFELPRIDDARYRRPYTAVWIEDSDHFPVRTLALWTQNPRWLPELKSWYRDDQIRNLAEGTDVSKTIGSATRPPGHYTLKWDGKDNEGKLVKAGTYTVVLEASREHGGYQVERHELDFNSKPQQTSLPPGKELGAVTLDYRKR